MKLVLACFVASCLLVASVDGGKVLVMSMQFGSHFNEFAAVSEGLLKMGHTIHVLVDENLGNPKQFKGMNVEFLHYKSTDRQLVDQKLFDDRVTDALLVKKESLDDTMKNVFRPRFTYDCKMALWDKDLIKRLENEHYDIAVVDPLIGCYHLIAYKLDIPVVTVSSFHSAYWLKIHPLANFAQPCLLTKDTNTFINRLKTVYNVVRIDKFILPNDYIDTGLFINYTPEKPYSSLGEVIMKTSKLYVINKNGVIDCPMATMPNLVTVAGLTLKPPKPLQPDYQEIVNEAKHGIIIVSFGSAISHFPQDLFVTFLNAFRKVKQNVIWRSTKTYGLDIPKNVKLVDWLPQNDLMAHPNVKLFITHCGNNGQLEALVNGVPMIGFPIFAEQAYNAERMAKKGFGRGLDIHKFNSEQLVEAISEIISNPKYSEAINRASAIEKSLPDPRSTAAFWIDHVMKHGADHLTTVLSDMSYVQFYMIDIFTFIVVVVLIVVLIVKKLIKAVVNKVRSGGVDKNKKAN